MKPELLAEFKQALCDLKKVHESRAEDNHSALQTVELDQNKVGRLSRMDALQGQQMAQQAERRRLLKLQQIEGALKRVSSGDFGCCFKCAADIALERLQFDPTLTRCIHCAEAT